LVSIKLDMPIGRAYRPTVKVKAAYLSLEGLLKILQAGVDDLYQPIEPDQLLTQDCIIHNTY